MFCSMLHFICISYDIHIKYVVYRLNARLISSSLVYPTEGDTVHKNQACFKTRTRACSLLFYFHR